MAILACLIIQVLSGVGEFLYGNENDGEWKAGMAKVEITPVEPMRMSGYASRDNVCSETMHPLWAKALAIEDAGGNRAVLVTMDLAFLTRAIADNVKDQINARYGLDRSQIILSWSHTHSGPVVRDPVFYDVLNLNDDEIDKVERYTQKLEDQIAGIAGEAINSMVPVNLYSGTGVTRIAVNRRINGSRTTVNELTEELKGPVDHSVPVIKVEKLNGDIMGVVFGYACHSTTLGLYQWSGDYPGFAQIELEKIFPGAVAMFFAGAGGDQNPLPRRTIAYARQYGKTLAAAVEAVFTEPMKKIEGKLVTGFLEVELPYVTLPDREELLKLVKESSGYKQKWASRILGYLEDKGSLPDSYPHYPLQMWRIGDQNLVVLGGEVVIDYTLKIKELIGPDTFVMSYANDEVFYIPSTRVLREGGYEGVDVLIYSGRPAPWSADIEVNILKGISDLVRQVGMKLPEAKLSVR